MPSELVQALVAHLDGQFEGPNGDNPSILEALAGVSVTQALWKPTSTQNSMRKL